jgi:S-adenosylmethionine synthetase
VDIEALVREKLREIDYTREELGIGADTCEVIVRIQKQSSEISQAVSKDGDPLAVGAGAQGIMVGFACLEEVDGAVLDTQLMPLPIYLAHKLCRRMALVRKEGVVPYLRPDGKSQVTVEYTFGRPKRVHTVVLSPQHDPDVPHERMFQDMLEHVVKPVIPHVLLDGETKHYVNPADSFVKGGPAADSGLTGRKILVDTYGSVARHGGGAFSGKDPTKVDRSGAYAARYVAKNLVAAGLAKRAEVQISYAIGMAEPLAVSVETFGTSTVSPEVIDSLVRKHFDLRPGAIIRDLELRRPIFSQTASYGHFGRDDLDLPWERTDKAEALARDAVKLSR